MDITSNLNIQKKNYSEVAPHNNRTRGKTKNRNIYWKFTKYDILDNHPLNYKEVMQEKFSGYVQHHDAVEKRNHHYNKEYGSVKNMLNRRSSKPYRCVVIGFGSGKIRHEIWHRVHNAYPQTSLGDFLKNEAKAMNQVSYKYNKLFPKMPLTDYSVHVDEIRYHTGQLHLQGRVALLGKTAKGKPSFSLNQAVKQSVEPHLNKYNHLYQRVHGKPLKRKPRNARERLSAYRLLADHATYRTVAGKLEKQYPKAHLNFHFTRTQVKSISHDRWQREQDDQRASTNAERASKASQKASQQANQASLARSSAKELVPRIRHRYSTSASKAASSAKSTAISTVASKSNSLVSRASYLSSSVSFASKSVARRSARVSSLANSLDYANQKTISLFTGKSTLASGFNGTRKAVSAVNHAISSAVNSGQSALNSVNSKAKKQASAYSNTPQRPERKAHPLIMQNASLGGKPNPNSDTALSSANIDLDDVSFTGQPSLVNDINSRLADYEMRIGTDPVVSLDDNRVSMAFGVDSKATSLNDKSGDQESLFSTVDSQVKGLSSVSANDFKILSNINSELDSGLGLEDDGPEL